MKFFPHSGSYSKTLHSKIFLKTLILNFEANSKLSCEIGFFSAQTLLFWKWWSILKKICGKSSKKASIFVTLLQRCRSNSSSLAMRLMIWEHPETWHFWGLRYEQTMFSKKCLKKKPRIIPGIFFTVPIFENVISKYSKSQKFIFCINSITKYFSIII